MMYVQGEDGVWSLTDKWHEGKRHVDALELFKYIQCGTDIDSGKRKSSQGIIPFPTDLIQPSDHDAP